MVRASVGCGAAGEVAARGDWTDPCPSYPLWAPRALPEAGRKRLKAPLPFPACPVPALSSSEVSLGNLLPFSTFLNQGAFK